MVMIMLIPSSLSRRKIRPSQFMTSGNDHEHSLFFVSNITVHDLFGLVLQATDQRTHTLMGKAIQAALAAVGVTDPDLQQQAMTAAQESTPSAVENIPRVTSNKRKRSSCSTIPANRLRRRLENDEVSDASNSLWETLNMENELSDESDHEHDILGPDSIDNATRHSNPPTPVDLLVDKEYKEDVKKEYLPPVSRRLAETISKWCRQVPDRERIRAMFKSTLIPENVEGLTPVRINEVLYQRLSYRVKINDQRLRGINTYLTRGLGPIVSALDDLLKFECSLHDEESPRVSAQNGILSTEKTQLDVQQLRRKLDSGVHLLAVCNSVCLMKRKTALRSSLDPKFHYLIKAGNEVTSDLLGSNLEQKISDSNKILSATKRFYPNVFPRTRRGGYTQSRGRYNNNSRGRSGRNSNQRRGSFRSRGNARPHQGQGYFNQQSPSNNHFHNATSHRFQNRRTRR